MAKMKDDELLRICKQESYQAESYVQSEISDEREDAMERYLGEDYGDEVGGQSQVVMRDTLETIEWAMPSLLRVFVSSDDIVSYEPEAPEDEGFAKQATDLANHVFYKDNNGFLILNTWFKDALLSKLGTVKTNWIETETTETKTLSGIPPEQFYHIASDDDINIDAFTGKTISGEDIEDDDEIEFSEPAFSYDVTYTRTVTKGRIEVMPVPPEEFYMSYQHADPDNATYLEHKVTTTRSDLIAQGFDRKVVEDLPIDTYSDDTGEHQTRMGESHQFEENADASMHEVTMHESYVYADTNDDGVAEWTKVIWVGDKVLERETVKGQPFSVITPIPVPHRAYGLSLADLVKDIARIRTTLMRQTLNSLYLANNPEREVDVNQIVDMDDFLTTRPGGIKRVEAIGATREISHPFVAQHSFAMLDGLDSINAKRTGISDATPAVDANALSNETATASNNNLAVRNQRMEMIARIFAETGVKHLFRRILHLLVENQDQPRTIKLRNKWVPMDASQWSPEMDVTIDVGLGHGNRDQQVTHLNNILMWQKEILASGGMGMVKPKHVYNTMERMLTTIGFKSADMFMDDPGDDQLQQPEQANPQEGIIQAQMQIEQQKSQANLQKAQMDNATKQEQIKLSHHEAMQKLELEAEANDIKREAIVASMNETAAKIRSDEAKAASDLEAKAKIELMKANNSINNQRQDLT
tara:strand:- start:11 stop:2110 length:2100 start_codon:yes stop_codon:yes gene_type:complete